MFILALLVTVYISKEVKLFRSLYLFVVEVKVKLFELHRSLDNIKYPFLLCDIESPALLIFTDTSHYFRRVTPTRTASNIRKLKAFFGEKVNKA